MSVDRRDFIKIGTAGMAGTYLAGCGDSNDPRQARADRASFISDSAACVSWSAPTTG